MNLGLPSTRIQLATAILTRAVQFEWLITRASGWLYYDANMRPWCPRWLAGLGARGVHTGEAWGALIDKAAARMGVEMLDVLAPLNAR